MSFLPFSEAEVATGSALWKAGKTAPEIATRLGRSTSSVLNFARRHRDKFPARVTVGDKHALARMDQIERRVEAKIAIASGAVRLNVPVEHFMPLPGTDPLPLTKATGCRWPVATEGDPVMDVSTHVCGVTRLKGASYCVAHAAMSVGQGTLGERSADRTLRAMA